MPAPVTAALTHESFTRFGDLLRFLRRRARLTQRELSIAVGYNFAQICRLEQGQRLPDPAVVAAVFVPALDLEHEPAWATRLIELAEAARQERQESALAALAPAPAEPDEQLAAPLDAFEALEAIPAPAPHEIARPRMAARLHARMLSERSVTLCGLAGMGKTTLAAALAREYSASTPVFWLTFTAGVTTSIEALLWRLTRFLLANGQHDLQPLLQSFGREGSTLPLDRQVGLISAALARLAEQTRQRRATPPLLCFDNAHLIQDDANIVHVLRHIADTSGARLLLTSRDNVQTLPGCAQVRLDGLEREEGLELIGRLTAQPDGWPGGSPPWATRLLEKTGGSPMLARLAIGQMLDEQAAPDTFIEQLESQPQIAAYLLETVRQRTSPAAWGLLSIISVFRQPVNLRDPALVELIQEADGVDIAAQDELIRRHLIDHPTRAYPHPLVRDYVYTGLIALPLHRRQLHRIAAEWSEHGLRDAVEASYHYCMAGDLPAAATTLAEHAETIGERTSVFAAADMATLVLSHTRRQREDTSAISRGLLALRGDLLVHTVRADEAEASYREALRLTDDPAARGRIAARLARSMAQRGQAAEAAQLIRQAIAWAPADIALQAQLAAAASQAYLALSSYDETVAAANRALELADRLGDAEARTASEARVLAHLALGKLMRFRQNIDAALRHVQSAIRAAQQANLAGLTLRCQMDEAYLLFNQGQYTALLERCAEFMPQLRASGDSYGAGQLYGIMALSHMLNGNLAAGLAAAEQSHAVRTAIGDVHGLVLAQNNRAMLLIAQGRVAQARAVVEQTLATYQPAGEMHDLGFALEKLAIVQMLEGDAQAALDTLRRALALPANASDPKLHGDLLHDQAIALLMAGQLEAAQQIVASHPQKGGVWVELEHTLLQGLCALAAGDQALAAAHAATLGARARAAGARLYEQRAELLARPASIPRPYDWPRLMWIVDPRPA